jgi:hypothetical protein
MVVCNGKPTSHLGELSFFSPIFPILTFLTQMCSLLRISLFYITGQTNVHKTHVTVQTSRHSEAAVAMVHEVLAMTYPSTRHLCHSHVAEVCRYAKYKSWRVIEAFMRFQSKAWKATQYEAEIKSLQSAGEVDVLSCRSGAEAAVVTA